MKARILVLLLLSLLLSGCTTPPEPEKTPYDLPAPVEPLAPQDEEMLPVLENHAVAAPLVSGPGGSVHALRYRNGRCLDPVYGDIDGDGLYELVYRTASAADGTVYEALWAYGLEQGLPVLEGSCLLRIGGAETSLSVQGSNVVYSCAVNQGETKRSDRITVTVEDGRMDFGETLPEGLSFAYNRLTEYGSSFRSLRSKAEDRLLAQGPCYFLWQEPGTFHTAEELENDSTQSYVCAAMTNNGVTVTGLVYWYTKLDGSQVCDANGVDNPIRLRGANLDGLAKQVLLDKLGDPFFEFQSVGNAPVLYWFTEDGGLLAVHFEDGLAVTSLMDLPIG